MNLRATSITRALRPKAGRRPAGAVRRPALLLAVAAAGALVVNVVVTNEPEAHAKPQLASVSVAAQLGIPAEAPPADAVESAVDSLAPLAASRSERAAEQTAAAEARAAAEQAELDRRAAEEAARLAAEEAARRAAEEAARAEAARAEAARVEAARAAEAQAAAAAPRRSTSAPAATAPAAPAAPAPAPAAPAGSFKEYAMGKVGAGQFSCLESLWGKESGWNPNAQNPSSTAYGIAQFLDSTWAGTGIAKTSDGYRQIDAGLIYIQNRYGTPCAAWAHSQSTGWY
ncbi:transglycosylase SLT domain-containing protein [Blastococcus sp. VKM Ac-2987]|uniref:aggregation-promoting factor C-terminal-like domain-containing protein n=1 Tax=Blastococcus sp. VKM Ac-2987 TaxID=3004141 RepID=UPI0022AB6C98|nr:transglycosylase SLT domain-containing protein [Blastococcus sp. VKM Ac-2987]MCZ2860399.1 transglycosylase SLT domain-containing protein [Blastococcus sp. VKM Ac-2987]